MNQVQAMIFLTAISVIVMVAIAVFVVRVFKRVDQQHGERYFGDLSHIKIPDDARELTDPKKKPKPPFRPW